MRETKRMRRGLVAVLVLVGAIGLALPAALAGNGHGHGNGGQSPPGQGSDHQTQGTAGTSGNPSQPQPPSKADQNQGGANGQCPGGPYCSTRDGSPSQNGNGHGQAKGKPCAGCVGKADNKNPPGQMPNGSDHNKGYECDKNHGVGKGNPAHSGCTQSPPPPCQSNCAPPPCSHDCSPCGKDHHGCPPPPCSHDCSPCGKDHHGCPPPPCQSNCAPPPCSSGCQPQPACSANCAPTSTPPGHPITVTCPKGGGTIMVSGPSGQYTITCQSGHKTVTPRQPGLVKVITKTHTVVQRVGVTAPSGSQLTG